MDSGICVIDGCEKPRYYSKDWCVMHFRRWQRNGDPNARVLYRGDPEGAFAARTRREGDCLVWTGAMSEDGYGFIKFDRTQRFAHTYAWERVNGPVPDGMQLDHRCHNRACVEVEHLRLASGSQNQWNRSRARSKTGHRNVYPAAKGRFYVQIRHGGQKLNYGSYSSVEEAASVAERAREALFGEFAGNG